MPFVRFRAGCAIGKVNQRKLNPMIHDPAITIRIRQLNDMLRTTWMTGKVLFTPGISNLTQDIQSRIAEAIQTFDAFTPNNDPYGEHDFGSVTVAGHRVFWKIDYYELDMVHGAEYPADPARTRRVLTIMLGEEY